MPTQELNASLVESVGFIKYDHINAGQELCHAGLTHGQVGKVQVMVDDHQISSHGDFSGCLQMAGFEIRTLTAQTIVAIGCDPGHHARATAQTLNFTQVTREGHSRPFFDPAQGVLGGCIQSHSRSLCQSHSMGAQIVGSTFQACRTHGQTQNV